MTFKSLSPLYHSTLGFEGFFDDIQNALSKNSAPSFPPHNIVKVSNNKYLVEIALAGFNKDEIQILVDGNHLNIAGEKKDKEGIDYLYRGIATRSFTKTLKIADTVVVKGADLKDGILTVFLENVIPEEKKPRRIEISGVISQKQFLTE